MRKPVSPRSSSLALGALIAANHTSARRPRSARSRARAIGLITSIRVQHETPSRIPNDNPDPAAAAAAAAAASAASPDSDMAPNTTAAAPLDATLGVTAPLDGKDFHSSGENIHDEHGDAVAASDSPLADLTAAHNAGFRTHRPSSALRLSSSSMSVVVANRNDPADHPSKLRSRQPSITSPATQNRLSLGQYNTSVAATAAAALTSNDHNSGGGRQTTVTRSADGSFSHHGEDNNDIWVSHIGTDGDAIIVAPRRRPPFPMVRTTMANMAYSGGKVPSHPTLPLPQSAPVTGDATAAAAAAAAASSGVYSAGAFTGTLAAPSLAYSGGPSALAQGRLVLTVGHTAVSITSVLSYQRKRRAGTEEQEVDRAQQKEDSQQHHKKRLKPQSSHHHHTHHMHAGNRDSSPGGLPADPSTTLASDDIDTTPVLTDIWCPTDEERSFSDTLATEPPPYNLLELDDPDTRSGKHRQVIAFNTHLMTLFAYVRPLDLKRDLNEMFKEKHPTVHLSLSKMRSLKRDMVHITVFTAKFEVSTVALAFTLFERVILKGYINKENRKVITAVCLWLAAKFHDPHATNNGLQPLASAIDKTLGVSMRHISAYEMSVLVMLDFKLSCTPDQAHFHLKHILAMPEMLDYSEALYKAQ